jgi:hypothetical protein
VGEGSSLSPSSSSGDRYGQELPAAQVGMTIFFFKKKIILFENIFSKSEKSIDNRECKP